MIRILSEFNPRYANAFRCLCSMRVLLVTLDEKGEMSKPSWSHAVYFSHNEEYMAKFGITFDVLNELESLGVIKTNTLTGFVEKGIERRKVLVYVNEKIIEAFSYVDNGFPVGNVLFTDAGIALSNITDKVVLEGYYDAAKRFLTRERVSVLEESQYSLSFSGESIIVNTVASVESMFKDAQGEMLDEK